MKQRANQNDILIGKALKAARVFNDEFVAELGDMLDLHYTSIVHYEQGATPIPAQRQKEIEDYYGVSLKAIIKVMTKKSQREMKCK